jgi:hypothetical protein
MARGRVAWHVCGVIALVLVLGAFAGQARATPERGSAPRSPAGVAAADGLFDGPFCDLIGNKDVQAAGLALFGYFAKKNISSESIYTAAVLTTVSELCKPVMKRAVPAIARFLGLSPRPKRAPTRSDFSGSFGRATAAGISEQLRRIGWTRSPSTVRTIAGALCNDVEHGVNPRPTLAKWFVNAKLDSLAALNGFVPYAATCTPAPTAAQLGYLTSSITSYLTDKTYPRDYTPPITLLWTPTETLLASGLVQVNIKWTSFDFGGRVTNQVLWIWTNNQWTQLTHAYAYVKPGQKYHLATRAEDAAGNWSSWAYTQEYSARRG